MTELEALAKDCIENHTHRLIDNPSKQDIYTREESIYISGYRECERRCKKDMENLATQSMILIQRNAKLEEQNEKMRNCLNCKHSEEDNKSSTICNECFELCYWEMKE